MNNQLQNNILIKGLAFLAIAFLLIPILLVITYSFNASKIMTTWGGFSLSWYAELFHDREIFVALSNSLIVAFTSSLISVFISVIFASIIVGNKNNAVFRKVLSIILAIQFAVPEVILGIAMLMLFVFLREFFALNNVSDMLNLIIAHSVLTTTYATTVITARLASINSQIFEVAEDLGASSTTTFMQITLPLIFPSIVSAWLLSFILSMDDVVIAIFNNGPGSTTLPVLIASRIRLGISPEVNALASILILIVTVILGIHFAVKHMIKRKKIVYDK
ncbi:MAG: ABC transporter permease [Alphaproteobacteria bacterium]|nr:ABC transporter permease [Alphaproteobacteria bacterium]OJV16254.1 MAG: hypothetical protein BGO27_04515 [Alphaproteobacteria bacterium 33-17]